MTLGGILTAPPTIVAAGVDVFSDALRAQGAEVHDVDWRPPGFGEPADLAALALDPRRAAANRTAVERLLAAGSVLVEFVRPMFAGSASPAGNAEIAAALVISPETVKSHLKDLYVRFGLESVAPGAKRAELAQRGEQILAALASQPGERLTVRDIMAVLQDRAFALLVVLLGLPNCLPMPPPTTPRSE